MNQKPYQCPQCKIIRIMPYGSYWISVKHNRVCRPCADKNRIKYHRNENGKYERKCPLCEKDVFYITLSGYKESVKYNSLCYQCSNIISNDKRRVIPDSDGRFYRLCPICTKKVYHVNGGKRNNAEKQNRPCRVCSNIKSSNRPEVKMAIRDKFKERAKDKIGSFVPSYNKKACMIFNLINTALGYGGVYMTNLFGLISSNPEDLRSCPNPVGDNDDWMDIIRAKCQHVIFAWGSFKQAEYRAKKIIYKFPDGYVFGRTAKGHPLHPLAAAVWQRKSVNFKQYHLS